MIYACNILIYKHVYKLMSQMTILSSNKYSGFYFSVWKGVDKLRVERLYLMVVNYKPLAAVMFPPSCLKGLLKAK